LAKNNEFEIAFVSKGECNSIEIQMTDKSTQHFE